MNWAYHAFFRRLEDAKQGDEAIDLAFNLSGGEEDIDPTEEMLATIKRWREESDL